MSAMEREWDRGRWRKEDEASAFRLTRDNEIDVCFRRAWIASRSLSSGAHPRDPLARNDGERTAETSRRHCEALLRRSNPDAPKTVAGFIYAGRPKAVLNCQ
jgi:hypothetical protein